MQEIKQNSKKRTKEDDEEKEFEEEKRAKLDSIKTTNLNINFPDENVNI